MNSLRSLLRRLNPIAWISSFRRSLTGASVTLLLIGIVSLNIVWGYPWLGMFSACFSMFIVGWLVNHWSVPKLNAIASAPRCAPADEEVGVPIRIINEGRWPGMDLVIEQTRKVRALPVGSGFQFIQNIRFHRRGARRLPPVLIESFFPFHLFRTRRWIDPGAMIMVTPKRLKTEDDSHWRTLENTLKGIASRAAQGDQIHYIGSREYREGVPVRHWDFSSWARLGRPILREFSSPASRSVRIVVDNVRLDLSMSNSPPDRSDKFENTRLRILAWLASWRGQGETTDPHFERIVSLAASSVETLVRNGAAVVLQFVYEPAHHRSGIPSRTDGYRCEAGGDPSEILIALGTAESYAVGQESLMTTSFDNHHQNDDEARIILSCRHRSDLAGADPLSPVARESNWVTDQLIESPLPIGTVDSPVGKDPSSNTPSSNAPPSNNQAYT